MWSEPERLESARCWVDANFAEARVEVGGDMSRAHVRQGLIIAAVAVMFTLYGVFARGHGLFPTNIVLKANELVYTAVNKARHQGPASYYYIATASQPQAVIQHSPDRLAPGMTLVSGMGPNRAQYARLVDERGQVLHSWRLDWNHIWPHPTHLRAADLPYGGAGVLSLGAQVSEKGDLTINFEQLGMVQLDVCGNVNWRLAKQANHSLFRDEAGNLWTQELVERRTQREGLPNYRIPFEEHFVLEVSPQGKVLRRISVMNLLRDNGYVGLLFMKSSDTWSTEVSGDTLHITSIAVFPSSMKSGTFKPGDVLLSLNAINTVIVFDPKTMLVKASLTGRFLRQADANFVDGDTITIFDNHQVTPDRVNGSSRILEHSFRTGADRVIFQGDAVHPFFTPAFGRHQRLSNGDILLTESTKGRVLEIDRNGGLVWEYFNVTGPRTLGFVEEGERVPLTTLTPERLKQLAAACPA